MAVEEEKEACVGSGEELNSGDMLQRGQVYKEDVPARGGTKQKGRSPSSQSTPRKKHACMGKEGQKKKPGGEANCFIESHGERIRRHTSDQETTRSMK